MSFAWVVASLLATAAWSLPTLEDNRLPTAEEVLSELRAGQPEEISPLSLPSDEESFNHLNVLLQQVRPASGTYHFVSSTFPEVDARGFHESVFEGIGDYYPTWSRQYKRELGLTQPRLNLAQRLGFGRPNYRQWKRSGGGVADPYTMSHRFKPSSVRRKRSIQETVYSVQNRSELSDGSWDTEAKAAARANAKEIDLVKTERVTGGSTGRGMSSVQYGERYSPGLGMGDTFGESWQSGSSRGRRGARGSQGFHADTFSNGFGDFTTMKRSKERELLGRLLNQAELYGRAVPSADKRRPEMDSMGFHGNPFSGGFGEFDTMKKRVPEMDSIGFHGNTFSGGFGDFETMKKRRPEMDSMGFHGNTFSGGFGEFDTMKKRRPEMDSMGFHGNTFSGGFGDFETMKKRRPEMDSMGFHGNTFSGGFGEFDTMKKRRPEMDSMGFHGNTFSGGFGDFETMKKSFSKPSKEKRGTMLSTGAQPGCTRDCRALRHYDVASFSR